jgi:hypothetical protein
MIIFGGVDGTGVWNDQEYRETFRFSFVHILYRNWTYGPRNYERGPVTLDNKPSDSTFLSAYKTYRHVKENWKAGESAVFLAGYSRGGAAVIEVAKSLEADYIPVECLILFDPVDRTGQVGLPWKNTPIASSVKKVIYAKRSPAAMSRESFKNCGLLMEDGRPTPYETFFATHGGLGGVPWPEPKNGGLIDEGLPDGMTQVTVEGDRRGAENVQRWAFGEIEAALSDCKERLNPSRPPLPRSPGAPLRTHFVQPGDWLSKLAITYYGDMNKWRIIYDHPQNRQTIGPNPDLIKPGQTLVIP